MPVKLNYDYKYIDCDCCGTCCYEFITIQFDDDKEIKIEWDDHMGGSGEEFVIAQLLQKLGYKVEGYDEKE